MIKKMTLNKTPIRTSNNYGINDIELDIDFSKFELNNNIEIKTCENEKLDIKISEESNNIFNSKIGLSFEKYYKIKIIVKENQIIENQIYIRNNLKDKNIFVGEIEILFEKNSSACFVFENICNNEDLKAFNYIKQVNHLNKNSKAKIIYCNLINDISDNFIAVENDVEEKADLEYNFIDIGGKNKISNYYTKLEKNESKNIFNNIYIGNKEELIDMNYHVEIKGMKSICNINVQGAITDYSKKKFKGTIDFIKGAEKSIGEENENCVILSDNAKSKSLPMLLCHEENVQGAHGVSSGRIDEEKLFYIMSKGISKKEAEKLIVMANFNSIIKNINDEKIQNDITKQIENKI